MGEVLKYRVGTIGADVTIEGEHACVEINSKGIWPLKKELRPTITVRIGYRKGATEGEALQEFPRSTKRDQTRLGRTWS